MLGDLWRLYKGVAVIVFSIELAYIAWAWFGVSGVDLPGGPLAGTPGPKPTATATPEPRAAERMIERSQTAVAVATPGARFALEMSEAEVNAVLAQQQGRAPGVRDITVRFQPGRVEVDARLMEPVPASVQAVGTLVARDGRLRIVVQEANAGPVPLPRAAIDLLQDRANAALDEVAALRNLYVESVEMLPGRARMTARARGG